MKDSKRQMRSHMINYSIIIPHKNIPDLLQRCLDSIPQREDLQVIVVDDNSDPDKVDFANFPGLDRADVECYFTKEGKGAGYARNVGLKYARGKWLLFADADDFFHDGMLGMLDKWKDSDNDIVYFETDSVDSDSMEPVVKRLWISPSLTTKKEMENNCGWQTPWGKMIRAELVLSHGILFDEIRWSNDVMFSARCSYYAGRNVDICSDMLYCATIRQNSLINEILSVEHIMCRLDAILRMEKFACRHHLLSNLLPNGVSSSFSYVSQMRQLGKKAHRKAKIHYLKHAPMNILLSDFIAVIRFRIRHKLFRFYGGN